MNSRKKPSQRERALLQQEIGSKCPICGNESVGEFQVHHLNGNPSDNTFTNMLLICPNCHAKFNNHSYSLEVGYQAKFKVWKPNSQTNVSPSRSLTSPAPIMQISDGDNVIQAAGNVTIKIPSRRKAKAAVPISGVIGTSPKERAYIQYLYDRLFDYKKATPGYNDKRAGNIIAKYVRDVFGTKWSYVPIDRFGALVRLLHDKIDETPIGRKHKANRTKPYSSFEEFCNK